MASYKVLVDKRVRKKDLPPLPVKDQARIVERITGLAIDPYPVDSIQLKGDSKRRVRQGNYRILYTVEESIVTVYIVRVGHRRDIYRKSK